jgi:hypothetical protein
MDQVLSWLLSGDISIQYLTYRDLLGSAESLLLKFQQRIPLEGFGARFLACQGENGHWGRYYYQPKWTSTHYTLLDLKDLGVPKTLEPCREMVARMFSECQLDEGGVNLSKYDHPSDIAVDGMILNYASYFGEDDAHLSRLVDYLISVQMSDGGFSWDLNAPSGDPHTTICVLEGLSQYKRSGYALGHPRVNEALKKALEFLLSNQLFFQDSDKRFRKLSYPFRYRYDLLRALELLARDGVPYDSRVNPVVDWLLEKRNRDGFWVLENQHKGNVHFELEGKGQPSRFITLKALVILKYAGLLEMNYA